MNKAVYMILLLTIASLTINCDAKPRLEKIKSFFGGYKLEKIDQRELPASSINTVAINNINGPITIKMGWNKNSIFLKTTKRAKKQEDLNNIKIVADSSKTNHLSITTKHIGQKFDGYVEYELIVPASLDITLNISGNGDASIKDVNGAINVITNDNIAVTNSKQLASLRTLKKGTILVANATGPVDARSHQGNITGENITNSFSAHSTSGKVTVAYKTVSSTSSIKLETTSGNIMLALPTDTNAEIRGYTAHGTLISDHYITLKPYATQLNSSAWNKFRKEVDGTLGTGEATIALHSTKGNVRITENKTT
jgi:hypothetical protein